MTALICIVIHSSTDKLPVNRRVSNICASGINKVGNLTAQNTYMAVYIATSGVEAS